jgi:hypothetical protein
VRQALAAFAGRPGLSITSEGLLILGWVAMWRPVEIFLYDWWPEFGKHLLFLRIAGMKIEVKPGLEEGEQVQARDARAPSDFSVARAIKPGAAAQHM